MKCLNCGFEFEEGIFCPECGTKQEANAMHKEVKVEKTEELVKVVEGVQQKQAKKSDSLSKLEKDENVKFDNLKKRLEKVKVQEERRKILEEYKGVFETEEVQRRYVALCEKVNQSAPKLEENHEKICKYSLIIFVISLVLMCVTDGSFASVLALAWLASIFGLILYGFLKMKIEIMSKSEGHYLNIKNI